MKHTPEPWKYEPETKTIRSSPQNYWLATMDSFDGAVNHDANAQLIAAAPQLLHWLTEIYTAWEKGAEIDHLTMHGVHNNLTQLGAFTKKEGGK